MKESLSYNFAVQSIISLHSQAIVFISSYPILVIECLVLEVEGLGKKFQGQSVMRVESAEKVLVHRKG